MIRIGLIGCGGHSERGHATPLARFAAQHPGKIELTAVCDLQVDRAARFASKFGFSSVYGDMHEMLERERLDGIVCIMPVNLIASTACELLSRGMRCVIEKPLGLNRTETMHLAEIARSTGTAHMVSLNRRFIPLLNRGLTWARECGPIRYVRGAMLRDRRVEPDFLWATGVHALDALRHIAGEIADYSVDVQKEVGGSTWRCVNLKFVKGTVGRLEIFPTAGMDEESYEIIGDGYRVIISTVKSRGMRLRCWRRGDLVIDEQIIEPHDVMRGEYDEVVEFVRALKSQTCPRPCIEDVLPSMEICWAMQSQAMEVGGVTRGCE